MQRSTMHAEGGRPGGGRLPLCRVEGLAKRYGGVHALRGVSLELHAGQVHALLGENGAGKSTLMKILAGSERADEGTVTIDGTARSFASSAEANTAGVAIVFQELSLFPDLDVVSNLFATRAPRRWGIVRRRAMERRAREVLDAVGLDVPLDARVETLPLDQRQLLEIAKALLVDARLLILDEPTSALTAAESERLFSLVRKLRAEGTAIVFVSHRLQEVLEISDVISVLRDGRHVATLDAQAASLEDLVTHMIGSEPSEQPQRPASLAGGGDVALALDGVCVRGSVRDVALEVRCGEVVGLAGLEDSGIRTLFEAVFGLTRADAGTIRLPDGSGRPRSAKAAVQAGVAYVPADRRAGGLMLEQTIAENVCQVTAGVMGSFGPVLSRRALREAAERMRERLRIRAPSVDIPVERLSGGNQQKVVLGKWLQTAPRVILLDDPTRGVDIGAKREIYRLVGELAQSGCAVVFHSSEMVEYEHTCHRVCVMRRGRLVGELAGTQVGEHALMQAINVDAPAAA